jgi:hypothetical protein
MARAKPTPIHSRTVNFNSRANDPAVVGDRNYTEYVPFPSVDFAYFAARIAAKPARNAAQLYELPERHTMNGRLDSTV